MTSTTSVRALPPRSVQRVRHPLKLRQLTVRRTERLTPHFVRVTFGGESLHDFVSASFDDHVKLMLPTAGEPLVLPSVGPDGPASASDAPRPLMRDYTPRRFDPQTCELDIEFALHGDGPAAAWAGQASAGQQVGIGGPRGSFIVPPEMDWHLLIGDDSALPAITRRLEELPATTRAIVLIESDVADRRTLTTRAALQLQWIVRDAPDGLAGATLALTLPPGEGYAWAAGEAAAMADTRRVLVDHHRLRKDQVRAAAYWKRGTADHHENL